MSKKPFLNFRDHDCNAFLESWNRGRRKICAQVPILTHALLKGIFKSKR